MTVNPRGAALIMAPDPIIGKIAGVEYNLRHANSVRRELAYFIACDAAAGKTPDAWQVGHFAELDRIIAADTKRRNEKSYARLASRRRD